MGVMKRSLGVLALLAVAGMASAQTIFDFESEPETDDLTELVLSQDGIEMTLSRTSGKTFDILDTDPFLGSAFEFPAGWGSRVMAPFTFQEEDDFFLANFDQEITEFFIEMGDFGADSDDIVVEAYSGLDATGNFLGSEIFSYGVDSIPNFAALGWSSTGENARSVLFRGGSPSFPNSVYMDNIQVNAVPEPATMTAAALGLAALAARRRNRR